MTEVVSAATVRAGIRPAGSAAPRRARSRAAGRPLRRRPCGHHDVLRARRRPRLHAALGAAALDGRPDGLPRPRGATGCRHRPGPDRAHPAPLRRRGRRRCPAWRSWCANLGTATAEFAGVAAGAELLGVSRYVAVPVAAVAVSWLVLAGSFHRVEHVLMALAAVFVAYVAAGVLAHPDWSAAFKRAGRPAACPSVTRRR